MERGLVWRSSREMYGWLLGVSVADAFFYPCGWTQS